jgi:hypothetical protein
MGASGQAAIIHTYRKYIATEVRVNDGPFIKPLIEGKGELGPGG